MKLRKITALILSLLMLCSLLTACTDEQIQSAADIAVEIANAAFEESDEPAQSEADTPVQTPEADAPVQTPEPDVEEEKLDEHGSYTTAEDVAEYLVTYGCLPENFITKSEARSLGWEGGSLEKYAPGKCIGGDKFGNMEGLLPKGKQYYECDINTLGAKKRGTERLIFSKDGYIYYTADHYESFTLMYSPED